MVRSHQSGLTCTKSLVDYSCDTRVQGALKVSARFKQPVLTGIFRSQHTLPYGFASARILGLGQREDLVFLTLCRQLSIYHFKDAVKSEK